LKNGTGGGVHEEYSLASTSLSSSEPYFTLKVSSQKPKRLMQLRLCQCKHHKDLIEKWRTPDTAEKPSHPDPDGTLKCIDDVVRSMACTDFKDLIRLNKQAEVGVKYVTTLRKAVAIDIGRKFLKNLEIVQHLLGMFEASRQEQQEQH
jgi:hypothetical protein